MVLRMQMVPMRQMRVMRRLLVRPGAVMLGRLAMMLGSGFVVLGQHALIHGCVLRYRGQRARDGIEHWAGDARAVIAVTVA